MHLDQQVQDVGILQLLVRALTINFRHISNSHVGVLVAFRFFAVRFKVPLVVDDPPNLDVKKACVYVWRIMKIILNNVPYFTTM
jgi:hypothetical protein